MEALPVPKVTARELNRSTSEVLKRVSIEKQPVVVTHHGDPIALLSPIASANGLIALLDRPRPGEREEAQRALENLSEEERRVLAAFPSDARASINADALMNQLDLDLQQITLTLVRLEIAGLIRKRPWGYVRV